MFFKKHGETNDKITTFLNSLGFYEKVNLFTAIEKANNPEKPKWLCYSEALGTVSEGKLEHVTVEILLKTGIH